MAKMSSLVPTQKTFAGALAGAIATIAVWALKTWAHIELPGEVSAALTVILTFAVSYMVPPGSGEVVLPTPTPTPAPPMPMR